MAAGEEALRRTVEALVRQNERLEERLAGQQRELASLRETVRTVSTTGECSIYSICSIYTFIYIVIVNFL